LHFEDLAREILSRIQDMRKKACFNIEDRITTWYQAEGELAEVFQRWGDYIASETLTANLQTGVAPAQSYVEEQTIEGGTVVIGMLQVR
jgi:isoleucyl-tRNA synthetase